MMDTYRLEINGREHTVTALPDMPLLWVLRDLLQLTGTKYGCGFGICGACTVHIAGRAARACITPVRDCTGQAITTIEGLSETGDHPVQKAWKEASVPQCGYCQSGQMMQAAAMLSQNAQPADRDIREHMSAVLCRCGTYPRIKRAIQIAAQKANR